MTVFDLFWTRTRSQAFADLLSVFLVCFAVKIFILVHKTFTLTNVYDKEHIRFTATRNKLCRKKIGDL